MNPGQSTRHDCRIIRQASAADIPFLVEGIIAAEKSGTERLSYCTIFGLSELELRSILVDVLSEDIVGQELCVSGFKVAEVAGMRAGAVCSWVEARAGRPSGVLKANLLIHFFGRARMAAAASKMQTVEALNFHRKPGALQLESVYVAAEFRGRGVVAGLIAAASEEARSLKPPIDRAQIILMKSNELALNAYLRAGFEVVEERCSDDPRILELLPASSKVLMEMPIN